MRSETLKPWTADPETLEFIEEMGQKIREAQPSREQVKAWIAAGDAAEFAGADVIFVRPFTRRAKELKS